MKVRSKSFAAGTVVNALATFKGVAFGIDLTTRVTFSEGDERGFYVASQGRIERSPVAEKIMRNSEIEGGIFEVESEIPRKSGLGSSSAFMNAMILCAFKTMDLDLRGDRILRLNARMSLEAGMSYTGAFDDASASLLGGFVFSDNLKMKLYRRIEAEGEVAILFPEWKRGEIDLERIRGDVGSLEKAFRLAMEGKFREAMLLNSMHYCQKIGLPLDPVYAVQSFDVSTGLSGNGPSYVAFGNDAERVAEVWESFGDVIMREMVSEPCDDVVIPESLFFEQ